MLGLKNNFDGGPEWYLMMAEHFPAGVSKAGTSGGHEIERMDSARLEAQCFQVVANK